MNERKMKLNGFLEFIENLMESDAETEDEQIKFYKLYSDKYAGYGASYYAWMCGDIDKETLEQNWLRLTKKSNECGGVPCSIELPSDREKAQFEKTLS